MPDQNPRGAGTERPRRLDEFELAGPEHLSPNESGISDPANCRQGEYNIREAWSQYCDQRDRQENAGKGQQDVDPAADQIVYPTPEVPRNGSEA